MSETVVKIENLSKMYRLGYVSSGTLAEDINRFWARIRGKEDPFLKLAEVNDRASKAHSNYVLALKNINLEVKKGERLGIIGRNGAGKSTLLKILSQVTAPTKGNVKIKGTIGSLLEVGTGFHGELTGRENIYMNGTILGMTKKEVSKKLDEIVDFSGVERYIDTPVKRYSSGMTVRLGFAVAAFLEPDILVVDEVLAVGDAEFQKKAIGKMHEVSEGHGRTILFVSHNMPAIEQLCTRAIIMKNGSIDKEGETKKLVEEYLIESKLSSVTSSEFVNPVNLIDHPGRETGIKNPIMTEGRVYVDGKLSNMVYSGAKVRFEIDYCCNIYIERLLFGIAIKEITDRFLMGFNNKNYGQSIYKSFVPNQGTLILEIEEFPLYGEKELRVDLFFGMHGMDFDIIRNAFVLYLRKTDVFKSGSLLYTEQQTFYYRGVRFSGE